MLLVGAMAMLMGFIMAGTKDMWNITNSLFGNVVAVTGDAHQSKVAQDIFRQEIRYERSLQIREDIRDVNKMMLESVQSHLFMGSILLGICFSMFVEGYPPDQTNRTIAATWIVFTSWSATYTLLSLWLALRFQGKISWIARERLLRRHRFMMPNDHVVGRMGGGSLVNQMAGFHHYLLAKMNDWMSHEPEEVEGEPEVGQPIRRTSREATVHIRAKSADGKVLDTEPLKPGLPGWLHPSGVGLSNTVILDAPFFLVGETLVRRRWFCDDKAFHLRVEGNATLYVAAQCPPRTDAVGPSQDERAVRQPLWVEGPIPEWPSDELPKLTSGFHEAWKGESGYGEFMRVEGFSIHVGDLELPIYKIVLASPKPGRDYVKVTIAWNFKCGCEALLVVLRQGQVHCKEEDWPIAEFNEEIMRIIPIRDFAGLYLKKGVAALLLAALCTYLCRIWLLRARAWWWFEGLLCAVAVLPALMTVMVVPIQVKHTDNIVNRQTTAPAPSAEEQVNTMGSSGLDPSGTMETCESLQAHGDGEPLWEAAVIENRPPEDPDRSVSGWPAKYTPDVDSDDARGVASSKVRPQDPAPRAPTVPAPSGAEWTSGPAFNSEPASKLGDGSHSRLRPPSHCHSEGAARGPARWRFGIEQCSDLQVACCTSIVKQTVASQSRQGGFRPENRIDTRLARSTAVAEDLEAALPQESPKRVRWSVETSPGKSTDTVGKDCPVSPIRQQRPWRSVGSSVFSCACFVVQTVKPLFTEESIFDAQPDDSHPERSTMNSTMRTLMFWSGLVRVFFWGSLLAVIIAHFSFGPLEDENAAVEPGAGQQLLWSAWHVEWPPFFQPTAAMLDASGGVLHAVDGDILRTLQRGLNAETTFSPVGQPLILRASALGLSRLASGACAVVGEAGVSEFVIPSVPGDSTLRELGPLAILSTGTFANVSVTPIDLASQLSPLSGAAVFEMEGHAGAAKTLAVIVAGADGGLYLCLELTGDPRSKGLRALTNLQPLGRPLRNITALHVCPAGTCATEPVLWAAARDGSLDQNLLVAVGLLSASELAAFSLPRDEDGSLQSLGAITGNATHLVVVTVAGRRRPGVFSVAYPSLPAPSVETEL